MYFDEKSYKYRYIYFDVTFKYFSEMIKETEWT